ncbi:MAG: hypothetical protein A2Z02_01425 [Chloroflexi bacterium RBG_16_48_7]|nr:MAG: hypothetical protein A2Z02_01425 [Chloroflexi bacterium RBG_16_48_7]
MTHVHVGPSIVEPIVNGEIIEIIRHHHDRYNGGGLGQDLQGEEIPIGARIVAVADTFDAITSDRPYRAGRSMDEAIFEIKRSSRTQLDPQIVEAFTGTPTDLISGAIRNPDEFGNISEGKTLPRNFTEWRETGDRRVGTVGEL